MNREKFQKIYAEIISLWPETLDVTEKKRGNTGGMSIKNLTAQHDFVDDHIEDNIIPSAQQEDADWYRLVDWSIFQKLHAFVKKEDCNTICPATVATEEDILKICLSNEEFAPDWEE